MSAPAPGNSPQLFLALEELPEFHRWTRPQRKVARRMVRWRPLRHASYWAAWGLCILITATAGLWQGGGSAVITLGVGQILIHVLGTTIQVRYLKTLIAEGKL